MKYLKKFFEDFTLYDEPTPPYLNVRGQRNSLSFPLGKQIKKGGVRIRKIVICKTKINEEYKIW